MGQTSFHVAVGKGHARGAGAGSSSPGMGAPRAEATVEEPRVPSRRKEPGKGCLEGHLGSGEGACLALPTRFGASVGGGESWGCPAGEPLIPPLRGKSA